MRSNFIQSNDEDEEKSCTRATQIDPVSVILSILAMFWLWGGGVFFRTYKHPVCLSMRRLRRVYVWKISADKWNNDKSNDGRQKVEAEVGGRMICWALIRMNTLRTLTRKKPSNIALIFHFGFVFFEFIGHSNKLRFYANSPVDLDN